MHVYMSVYGFKLPCVSICQFVCLSVCACMGSVTCDCVSMYVLVCLSVCLSVCHCVWGWFVISMWFPCDCVYGVCDFHVCVFVWCLCPCLSVYVYISDYLCVIVNTLCLVMYTLLIYFFFLHRESHNQYFEVSQSIIHYIIIDYTFDDGLL